MSAEQAKAETKPGAKGFSPLLLWQVAAIVLVVVLAVSIVTQGFSFTGFTAGELTAQQAADKAIAYINDVLQGQATATLISVTEANGLYSLVLDVGGQEFESYMTKDGALLFPSAINVANWTASSASMTSGSSSSSASEYPKSDRPVVELFVMSFCPYGVQAEQAMKPVVDLLGDAADIKVKFIVNVNGDAPSDVQSLHGAPEAIEDLRQVCIRENYNQTVFWNYVLEIGANCYAVYRNATAMDACWRAAASAAGVDATALENCVNSTAVSLIRQDEAAADEYGVRGSPTLIINGKKYSGSRSPNAFKQAICSAFNEPPAACGSALSSTETAAQGGCG